MNTNDPINKIKNLAEIIHSVESNLAFTIFEIGALPIESQTEPFHQLLDLFPKSEIIAFEIDAELCEQLNKNSKPGLTFHPVALGRKQATKKFYETNHPMCGSLYKPNEKLISLYHNMDVAMIKSISSVNTVSLDYFTKENNIRSADFIKIDIQGAELDVFKGGEKTLKDVVTIISEVEFIPHYINQPLFGDVSSFLSQKDFMFHKFLGMAGRALKPLVVGNNLNSATQHMWSDAVFIKDIFKIPKLSSKKLLKLGMFAYMYGSPDITFHCFKIYDEKNATDIHKKLLEFYKV